MATMVVHASRVKQRVRRLFCNVGCQPLSGWRVVDKGRWPKKEVTVGDLLLDQPHLAVAPALPGTGAGAQEDRQRQPRSSVCSDCAQLFPMMSVDWGMCSLVVAPRAGFGRVRFRVEPARRPCATPSSGRSRVHDADPTYRAGFSRRSTPPHALRALRPAPCTATPCPLRLRTLSCTCSSF